MRQRAERAMIIKQLLHISQFDGLKTRAGPHSVADGLLVPLAAWRQGKRLPPVLLTNPIVC